MHEQRKQTVAVHRLRRRVKEFERQAAPWPWRARARRQLREVEGRKEWTGSTERKADATRA